VVTRRCQGLRLESDFRTDFTRYFGSVENPGCHRTSLRPALDLKSDSIASHPGKRGAFRSRYNGSVMISPDLLAMLVCPVCKQPVVLNANGPSLKCGECRRVYPIQDDIPIMLVDAATFDAA